MTALQRLGSELRACCADVFSLFFQEADSAAFMVARKAIEASVRTRGCSCTSASPSRPCGWTTIRTRPVFGARIDDVNTRIDKVETDLRELRTLVIEAIEAVEPADD